MISYKKGQVSIWVILAIILVFGIVLYFVFKGGIDGEGQIPKELTPVFDYYLSCIEEETRVAIELAGSQGGYVDVPDYVPGSDYAPFSSHLNFLGFPVPYWYYLTGNGFIREQIPSKADMEQELENYLDENLKDCDFSVFGEAYVITQGAVDTKVEILDNAVNVEVDNDIFVAAGEKGARRSSFNVKVNSKLGKFYNLAKRIYSREKSESFLETYAVDTLYSYAPVDGVEVQCGPKIWSTQNVINDLKTGLANNFQTIKLAGDYYQLKDENRKYFIVDEPSDEAVNFIYSKGWPTKAEI